MRWSVLVLAASLCVAACGNESSGGPPKGTGGSGGTSTLNDGDLPEDFVPEPGVCRALCCADTDCAAGETCTAFDSKAGTLGVCSPGWAGSDGGDPDAGAPDPDAGTPDPDAGIPDPDAGAPSFPESCWTVNEPECNPLTNESCAAGGACDVGGQGDPTTQPVVSCYYDDNTQGPGEICDNVEGPFCVPGYHCVPN